MTNELIKINNVRGYLDSNNTAWLNLEDIALGEKYYLCASFKVRALPKLQ